MGETVPVTYTVTGFERVAGAGRLVGLATIEVEIAGLGLTLQGVQVVREGDGTLTCKAPAFRHPRDGRWLPAVVLPPELRDAIGREVVELVP